MKKLITRNRDHLEQEVVEWLIRLTSGEASPDDFSAFAKWRARSPAHTQAYSKISALWQNVDKPLLDWRQQQESLVEIALPDEIDNMKTECDERNYPLKELSSVLFIAAMITFLAINLFPDYVNFPLSDYHTRIGEQRAVTLSDGSVVHLNTDTAINASFSQNVRNIQLLKGEAEFEVAHDASKPFIVISGSIQTRAIGTQFIVRYNDSEGQVALLEGQVLVKAGGENYNKSSITLNPGEQAAFNKNHLEPLVHLDTKGIDAWKKGQLQMNFVSLDQAITEINRYRRGTVRLLDRRLTEHQINAVIDIKHIDAWLETLEATLPVKLYRLGSWAIIQSALRLEKTLPVRKDNSSLKRLMN